MTELLIDRIVPRDNGWRDNIKCNVTTNEQLLTGSNTTHKKMPKPKRGKQSDDATSVSSAAKRSEPRKSRPKKPKDIAVATPKGKRSRKETKKKNLD